MADFSLLIDMTIQWTQLSQNIVQCWAKIIEYFMCPYTKLLWRRYVGNHWPRRTSSNYVYCEFCFLQLFLTHSNIWHKLTSSFRVEYIHGRCWPWTLINVPLSKVSSKKMKEYSNIQAPLLRNEVPSTVCQEFQGEHTKCLCMPLS